MTQLIRYEAARTALAECQRIDEVKDIRDKAEAMAAYARQAKDTELIQWATEIKVRAERRAGEMLAGMKQRGELASQGDGEKFGANRHSSHAPTSVPSRLSDIGITKDESSRYQSLASMSDEHFETAVATAKDTAGQVTTAFMLRAAKNAPQRRPRDERIAEIRAMAESGHIPEQIAKAQGIGVERVRELLIKAGIKIAVQKRGRAIDPNKIVRESVAALSGIAQGLSLVHGLAIDAEEAGDLLADLRSAFKALRALNSTLKEIVDGK